MQFSEPLSFLQCIAAWLEYQHLLIEANKMQDRGLQCLYILSAFVIILANTERTVKKPFNPLLGETFEYTDPEFGTRFFAEQVSHHPPISAFHAENSSFVYQGWIQVKIELGLSGIYIVTLGTSVHNLLIGETFVWHEGDFSVRGEQGHEAVISLNKIGFLAKKNFSFTGKVLDPSKRKTLDVFGEWNKEIWYQGTDKQRVVHVNQPVEHYEQQFSLSGYAIAMNNLTWDMVDGLPVTDSRFRTDIRAYESGDFDLANEEKDRIESLQRERP